MAIKLKNRKTVEFGDFQTPLQVCFDVCTLLSRTGLQPATVVEPTCGVGNFLLAALQVFSTIDFALGMEINTTYVTEARNALQDLPSARRATVTQHDFFQADWSSLLANAHSPILVLGNPPWVTNAELGRLGSSNLPEKSNVHQHGGFDALTGKSNFDISEWILLKVAAWLQDRGGTMAMLCKTAVARKILAHCWKESLSLRRSDIYSIDAAAIFGATVDACLLVCDYGSGAVSLDCAIHPALTFEVSRTIGSRDGLLLADVAKYEKWKHLIGSDGPRWRSGIKHDCAEVMELTEDGRGLHNGLGESIEIEDTYCFPMLKSSEIAAPLQAAPSRRMVVTQMSVGDDTSNIRNTAPRTWDYLNAHAERLDRRRSTIYRNRPRFAVFGVGPYSFAPWKVGISGMYKQLLFKPIPPFGNKPVVLDDTAYFLPCSTKEQCNYLCELLNSPTAREFFEAFVFWDSKRPITVEVLSRLDLRSLAQQLGSSATFDRLVLHDFPRQAEAQASLIF